MKTLLVLRHAKSDWSEAGLDDHDRPLNARGRRAAPLIATWLRERGLAPALVLCSSARRTRETLDLISPAFGDATEVEVTEDLYLAPADALLERLQQIRDDVSSVLLLGHNPGLHALVRMLAARGAARSRIERRFPTAALAVIGLPEPRWSAVEAACGHLVDYVEPRELE